MWHLRRRGSERHSYAHAGNDEQILMERRGVYRIVCGIKMNGVHEEISCSDDFNRLYSARGSHNAHESRIFIQFP